MKGERLNDRYYRFVSAQGLEFRESYSRYWQRVTGPVFEAMNADELEHCARVMRAALKESPNAE